MNKKVLLTLLTELSKLTSDVQQYTIVGVPGFEFETSGPILINKVDIEVFDGTDQMMLYTPERIKDNIKDPTKWGIGVKAISFECNDSNGLSLPNGKYIIGTNSLCKNEDSTQVDKAIALFYSPKHVVTYTIKCIFYTYINETYAYIGSKYFTYNPATANPLKESGVDTDYGWESMNLVINAAIPICDIWNTHNKCRLSLIAMRDYNDILPDTSGGIIKGYSADAEVQESWNYFSRGLTDGKHRGGGGLSTRKVITKYDNLYNTSDPYIRLMTNYSSFARYTGPDGGLSLSDAFNGIMLSRDISPLTSVNLNDWVASHDIHEHRKTTLLEEVSEGVKIYTTFPVVKALTYMYLSYPIQIKENVFEQQHWDTYDLGNRGVGNTTTLDDNKYPLSQLARYFSNTLNFDRNVGLLYWFYSNGWSKPIGLQSKDVNPYGYLTYGSDVPSIENKDGFKKITNLYINPYLSLSDYRGLLQYTAVPLNAYKLNESKWDYTAKKGDSATAALQSLPIFEYRSDGPPMVFRFPLFTKKEYDKYITENLDYRYFFINSPLEKENIKITNINEEGYGQWIWVGGTANIDKQSSPGNWVINQYKKNKDQTPINTASLPDMQGYSYCSRSVKFEENNLLFLPPQTTINISISDLTSIPVQYTNTHCGWSDKETNKPIVGIEEFYSLKKSSGSVDPFCFSGVYPNIKLKVDSDSLKFKKHPEYQVLTEIGFKGIGTNGSEYQKCYFSTADGTIIPNNLNDTVKKIFSVDATTEFWGDYIYWKTFAGTIKGFLYNLSGSLNNITFDKEKTYIIVFNSIGSKPLYNLNYGVSCPLVDSSGRLSATRYKTSINAWIITTNSTFTCDNNVIIETPDRGNISFIGMAIYEVLPNIDVKNVYFPTVLCYEEYFGNEDSYTFFKGTGENEITLNKCFFPMRSTDSVCIGHYHLGSHLVDNDWLRNPMAYIDHKTFVGGWDNGGKQTAELINGKVLIKKSINNE